VRLATDCIALKLTLNKAELNPKISRCALEMENYDLEISHRAGKGRYNNILIVETKSYEENLDICQGKDLRIKKLKPVLEKAELKLFETRNGVVYREANDNRILFYVPEEMGDQVLYKYHNEIGHIGRDKMMDIISKTYWFPN